MEWKTSLYLLICLLVIQKSIQHSQFNSPFLYSFDVDQAEAKWPATSQGATRRKRSATDDVTVLESARPINKTDLIAGCPQADGVDIYCQADRRCEPGWTRVFNSNTNRLARCRAPDKRGTCCLRDVTPPDEDVDACGEVSSAFRPTASHFVTGGPEVRTGQYPWVVHIKVETPDYEQSCGGAVVSPSNIIAARHCIQKEYLRNYWIYAGFIIPGASDSNQYYTHRRRIFSIAEHPDDDVDIAVLTIDPPLRFGDLVRKICLPKAEYTLWNRYVHIEGWEAGEEGGHYAITLQTKPVEMADQMICKFFAGENRQQFYPYKINASHVVCTLGEGRDSVDACRSGSGGPLFLDNEDHTRSVIVGLNFGGRDCNLRQLLIFATKLWPYMDWVNSEVDDELSDRKQEPSLSDEVQSGEEQGVSTGGSKQSTKNNLRPITGRKQNARANRRRSRKMRRRNRERGVENRRRANKRTSRKSKNKRRRLRGRKGKYQSDNDTQEDDGKPTMESGTEDRSHVLTTNTERTGHQMVVDNARQQPDNDRTSDTNSRTMVGRGVYHRRPYGHGLLPDHIVLTNTSRGAGRNRPRITASRF